MTEHEQLEAELRRTLPARAPADFLERLRTMEPERRRTGRLAAPAPVPEILQLFLRWLMPAAAAVVAAAVLWRVWLPSNPASGAEPSASATPALRADDVKIDRELVGSFDAVARLPGGEPVRFRCREWMENVTWQDKARGVVVEQRGPRVEVVPVRFETY